MPERLFKTELAGLDLGSRRFAVTADGQRFFFDQASEGETPVDTTMLRVILNWSGMPASKFRPRPRGQSIRPVRVRSLCPWRHDAEADADH